MQQMMRASVRSAAVMVAFAVAFTGLMAVVHALTEKTVKANEEKARLELITQVLPDNSFDNNLLSDVLTVDSDQLGRGPHHIWRARKGGVVTGLVVESTAPDGYSGAIAMLIGVAPDGRVTGVRVVSHKETPGLGDYIDIARSEWIRVFDGKSLDNPDAAGWQVRKDGGVFVHAAGATVTPRAVIKAVHRALGYVDSQAAALWEKR